MIIHNVEPEITAEELEELKELGTTLAAEYKVRFPESLAGITVGLFKDTVHLHTYIGNKGTFPYNIPENDQLKTVYTLKKSEKGVDVTLNHGSSLTVNPPVGSYYALSRVKIPFRKKAGNEKKIIEGMAKHFDAMKVAVIENMSNIHYPEKLESILNNLKA